MSARRRLLWALGLAAIAVVAASSWESTMFGSGDRGRLRTLLGSDGALLVDDATVAAWQPDENYVPKRFHALRALDEATFRRLAAQVGLKVGPSPAAEEAIWRLPEGVTLAGWRAPDAPPAGALQASGQVGTAGVWLRWFDGTMYMVALGR